MNRLLLALTVVVALTSTDSAQGLQGPQMLLPEGLTMQFNNIRSNLTRMAEKMPAEAYAFQPTPEVRTFAAHLAHLIGTNLNQCNLLRGTKHALTGPEVAKMTAKADLVKAVQDSFQHCGGYFDGLKESAQLTDTFFETPMTRGGQQTRAKAAHGVIVTGLVQHNSEVYGYLAMYLRLKGIVPPSSEQRPH